MVALTGRAEHAAEYRPEYPKERTQVKHAFAAILAAILLPLCAAAQPGTAPGRKIAVTIDAGKTSPAISPYIYGQFIEHIGDLINRSLWAEKLDDRKFYNDISAKPAPGAGRGGRVRGR